MQDSICPKGWGLPINGNAQTSKSWINLLFTSYNLQDNGDSSTNAHKTPLSLVYSGSYYWIDGNLGNRGSGGYFWSSTASGTTGARYLYFNSTRLVPQSNVNKIDGLTIRCVAQKLFLIRNTNYSLQDNDSTSSLNTHKTPLSLVYSGNSNWAEGYLAFRGSNGYFWSSTPDSTAIARVLDFYSTRLLPLNGGDKVGGFTIRCVAQ